MPVVLHVVATAQRRGAESFAMVLGEALEARGWTSRMCAVRTGAASAEALDVEVLGRHWADLQGLRAFRRAARAADVVIAHGSTTLWTAVLGLVGTGVPFVYVNIGDPRFWTERRSRRLRVAALLRRAALVSAISPRSAAALRDHLRVPTNRIRMIPNARSPELFRPPTSQQRRQVRRRLGLPEHRDLALYLGSLTPEKRVDIAVAAVAAVPDLHLVVAGAGILEQRLRLQADEILPGRAHFLGSVKAPQEVLAAADVLVLTSSSEGVPGVLIEAGLTGLPAVTSDVGFAADVVLDGVTGVVVPSDDPARISEGLVQALAQRARLGQAARDHCQRVFALDVVADTWDGLLRTVADEDRSMSPGRGTNAG